MSYIHPKTGIPVLAAALVLTLFSCKKIEMGADEHPDYTPSNSSGTLKEAASFPVGVAIGYDLFKNNAAYAGVVKSEFDNVTFEYQMKHGAILKNDGSKDYSRADELVALSTAAGLPVYGHTLVWHQNNNGDFLRSFAAAPPSNPVNLYAAFNGDFESGSGNSFPGWNRLAGDGGSATYDVETANAHQGARAFKVTVNTLGSNSWSIQALGSNWTAEVGKQYQVKVFARATTSGNIKLVNQNSAYAETTISVNSSWAEYVWNYTATEASPQFKLQFPQTGTFYVDDIRIVEAPPAAPGNASVSAKMDSVLKDWIQGVVNRYKDKVRAWDAVNEPFTDGTPVLRDGAGTSGDIYYWAQFLGRSYISKAFTYAREVDPTCDLFLNEYNLESNAAKLDSIVAMANALKAQGVPITGVGTQMHISINTPHAGIVQMFKKLASTGLKIKVTELDVRINPNNLSFVSNTKAFLDQQAAMYRFVVEEYRKNIPAAQQFGITLWNVGDADSWIVVSQGRSDFPTLFDKDFKKKPAYEGFLQGLKTQQ